VVLLGSFAAAIGANSSNWVPSTDGLPPNQAGYLWCCGATDVAATWEVPRMVPSAEQSAEGVWIGLQTNSGSFFLQVGTQDNMTAFSPQYEGFWSNGPLHGAPVNLGTVQPGDVVRARLAHTGSTTWSITFADRTEGWSHTREVTYPATYAHSIAEWIEEDPAEVIPFEKARLFVMGRTHGTKMRALEVNGGAPRAFNLQPESFVDGTGTTFSPSSLANNSFHFLPW
jgi:Peptidase A4 family